MHDLLLGELMRVILDLHSVVPNIAHAHKAFTKPSTSVVPKTQHFCQKTNSQCICSMWGHDKSNCKALAMYVACMQFYNTEKKFCMSLLDQYCLANDQSTKFAKVH